MTKIPLDATGAKKLQELGQIVELCDLSGKVIGRFVPVVDLSQWEFVGPDISEEELDRRAKSNEKRYTTKEVVEYLNSLEKQ